MRPRNQVSWRWLASGTPLTEAMLVVQWLERSHPPRARLAQPSGPASSAAGVLARAGIATGAIEAPAITIITRKVTAPALFDDTPVGPRRRRSMVEGMQRLEAQADAIATTGTPLSTPSPQ